MGEVPVVTGEFSREILACSLAASASILSAVLPVRHLQATIPAFAEQARPAQWADLIQPFFFGPAKLVQGIPTGNIQGTMSWQDALARTVTGLGYDLVDVERSTGGLLRVTIDRLPSQAYTTGPGDHVLVEDCEVVTRQLQYLFEVENVDYHRLEVSSPGLDRPIRKPADWQRFVGAEVEITLREPFQNRRKWRGVLAPGGDASAWRLELPPAGPPRLGPGGKPLKGPKPGRVASGKAAHAGGGAAPNPQQVLDFLLDEVREARLVPLVDFKGRAGMPADELDQGHALEAEKVDGGQD